MPTLLQRKRVTLAISVETRELLRKIKKLYRTRVGLSLTSPVIVNLALTAHCETMTDKKADNGT